MEKYIKQLEFLNKYKDFEIYEIFEWGFDEIKEAYTTCVKNYDELFEGIFKELFKDEIEEVIGDTIGDVVEKVEDGIRNVFNSACKCFLNSFTKFYMEDN